VRNYRGHIRAYWELPAGLMLQTEHRAGTIIEPHAHDDTYLSVVLYGGYTEHVPLRAPRHAKVGRALAHGCGEEHADYFHADSLVLNLELHDRFTVEQFATQARTIVPSTALDAFVPCVTQGVSRLSRPAWALELEGDFYWCSPRPLQRAAERTDLHPTHLSRAFHRHFGETMCSYRDRKRSELLASRLTESNDRLSEIAFDAGYADQSHMTASFLAHSGMTPKEFRARFRLR
jgi:AraC-like DNA-binding protein